MLTLLCRLALALEIACCFGSGCCRRCLARSRCGLILLGALGCEPLLLGRALLSLETLTLETIALRLSREPRLLSAAPLGGGAPLALVAPLLLFLRSWRVPLQRARRRARLGPTCDLDVDVRGYVDTNERAYQPLS